jgi:hypothetical protein
MDSLDILLELPDIEYRPPEKGVTLLTKENVINKLERYKIICGDCWIFIGALGSNGYGLLHFEGKNYRVHRLSAFAYLDFDLDSSLLVCHKLICPNRDCFNPDHLYVGTKKDNIRDSVIAGTNVNVTRPKCPHEDYKSYCYICRSEKRREVFLRK